MFYLRQVKTRQDLAKELDVEVGASLSAPAGSLDASTKVVKTFKQSSTTVTFLVRALRSYTVANRGSLVLTPEAHQLLKGDATGGFLRKCGGSFAQSVRYEAQVVALMQFEAQTEESARKIEQALGGSTPQLVPLANARADLKTKAEQTASRENASLSLTVVTSGFLSQTQAGNNIVDNSFEKIDELRTEMARSFDADLASDRRDYFSNRARNIRPASVGQASYAQIADAPRVDFGRITSTLARAEEFVRYLGPVQLRMETAYNDEVMRFLQDSQNNQFRYNLVNGPKLTTQELVPIAQQWATRFGPDGTRNPGSLIDPLRLAIERCQSAASSGDYSACTSDRVVDGDKRAADTALTDYARNGRIVPMSAWMPEQGTSYSYHRAEDKCAGASMRLPKRDEMRFIAPSVTALAGPRGEVWFASDAQCAKPFFANGSGQGTFGCADNVTEPLPYVEDRPIVCVGRSGPVGALPAP